MAIDYIIGAFQLLSAAVNVLALGSFWVTPGLRTTANRFVINLLVVNLFGCLALTPALWLHGGLTPTVHNEIQPIYDSDNIDVPTATTSLPLPSSQAIGSSSTTVPTLFVEIISTNQRSNEDGDDVDDGVEVIAEVHEDEQHVSTATNRSTNQQLPKVLNATSWSPTKSVQYSDCTRFWGFDLVAALGGLSVMLVVGDTYMAVTDPLRYHSRISGLKSWVLIAGTWFISILFCIASAFRRDCRLITIEITSTLQNGIHWMDDEAESTTPATTQIVATSNRTTSMVGDSFDDLYNLIYSCTFFVIIILLPIFFVCAMYFRIFSEARQNGLRMRQNGSSPLLQSALNLATASAHLPPAQLDHCCTVIGEEDSDKASEGVESLASSRSNVMHSTMRRNSMATTTSPIHHVSIKDPHDEKTASMKFHSSTHKLNTFSHHQSMQRRYLEIPKFSDSHSYRSQLSSSQNCNADSSDESTASKYVETNEKASSVSGSPRLYNHQAYSHMKIDAGNELRQVHSTPDLQKSIHAELLLAASAKNSNDKKIHSTGSIHKHSNAHLANRPRQRTPSICAPPKALSYMTSIRHRLSNASSIFKYREESRAARISILVVIMFLFSYFPYGLLVLLQGRATFYANSSFLGVLFLLIANMTSPFIFAYRNRRVRRGVCRLFGVDAKTNERLQKQRMIMRNSTHANSCRERKHKTKIVRINRNSSKSASFCHSTMVPCKYTQVPLNAANNECNVKFTAVESAVLLDAKSNATVVPINSGNSNKSDCRVTMLTSTADGLDSNDDSMADCTAVIIVNHNNSNSCNKRDQSTKIDETAVAKYVKDIVNNINCVNGKSADQPAADRISDPLNSSTNINNNNNISGISNCNNNNNNNLNLGKTSTVNKLNSSNCNIGTATGANQIIKQKISLLRRVCKTSRKPHSSMATTCGSPTNHAPPTTVNQFSTQPVNV